MSGHRPQSWAFTTLAGDASVCGLAAAIAAALLAAGQWPAAWLEVIGPSRLVALALIAGFGAWLRDMIRSARLDRGIVTLTALTAGAAVPVAFWVSALLGMGLWSALRGTAPAGKAATLIGLAALGLHVALTAGRLPELVSFALGVDATLVAALIELSGRPVAVRETVLWVESGVSLRLISACSSIWPLLSVVGALGAAMGLLRLGSGGRACGILALAAGAVVCLNVTRLAAMSTSAEAYAWLHDGPGTVLFRLLLLASIVVALGIAAARRPNRATALPNGC